MKAGFRGILTAAILVCFSQLALAGGSVKLSDIQPLLNQQPALWKLFTDQFDISPDGGGLRLGAIGIPLRGYRVGPYEFPAKVKGSPGDYNLKIIITTDAYFLDAGDKEVTDEMKGVKLEEVLTQIGVGPLEHPKRHGSFVRQ